MKKLLLLFLILNYGNSMSQICKSEEICNTQIKKIAVSKGMKYDSQDKFYYKEDSNGLTDMVIAGKNGMVKNYIKFYYYLNDEKKEKALSIFIDESFEKNEEYADEDSLDAQMWISKEKRIGVVYTPIEPYNLKITVGCTAN